MSALACRSQHLPQKQILKPVFLYLLYVTEDTYERTLTVDGEETTLIVMDNWENDKLVQCVNVNIVTKTRKYIWLISLIEKCFSIK